MAGNNDFLPVAINPGAPVDNQASYAASVPANGRGAGIVPKENYNKMFRQSSSIAAMIGKFIADAGFNANDDGNIAALTAAFAAALGGANSAPASYSMRTINGAARTRSVILTAGTWEFYLRTWVGFNDLGSTYNLTATQAASVGILNINTSVNMYRSGGDGYGRAMQKSGAATGQLVVATAATFTMAMAAVTLAGLLSYGSELTLEKLS